MPSFLVRRLRLIGPARGRTLPTLAGDSTCEQCGCEMDRWSREVSR